VGGTMRSPRSPECRRRQRRLVVTGWHTLKYGKVTSGAYFPRAGAPRLQNFWDPLCTPNYTVWP